MPILTGTTWAGGQPASSSESKDEGDESDAFHRSPGPYKKTLTKRRSSASTINGSGRRTVDSKHVETTVTQFSGRSFARVSNDVNGTLLFQIPSMEPQPNNLIWRNTGDENHGVYLEALPDLASGHYDSDASHHSMPADEFARSSTGSPTMDEDMGIVMNPDDAGTAHHTKIDERADSGKEDLSNSACLSEDIPSAAHGLPVQIHELDPCHIVADEIDEGDPLDLEDHDLYDLEPSNDIKMSDCSSDEEMEEGDVDFGFNDVPLTVNRTVEHTQHNSTVETVARSETSSHAVGPQLESHQNQQKDLDHISYLPVLNSAVNAQVPANSKFCDLKNAKAFHLLGNGELLQDCLSTCVDRRTISLNIRVKANELTTTPAWQDLLRLATCLGRGGRRSMCDCHHLEHLCNVLGHGVLAVLLVPAQYTRVTQPGRVQRIFRGQFSLDGDEDAIADTWLMPLNHPATSPFDNLVQDVLRREIMSLRRLTKNDQREADHHFHLTNDGAAGAESAAAASTISAIPNAALFIISTESRRGSTFDEN
ncbi:hypothetical protein DFJ77DRAFT_217232 [Powellomyces hirtus]|nr:hypothetical protein DFJ77DRAFT_217232 [Powellomyces hirtus]